MGTDPFHNLPFDDDTLAALVEGDLGSQDVDAMRERLLAADPRLAAVIECMERDRIMLRALGDERPPRGLSESVVARLEREALVGLAQGEPTTGSLRVSTIRHTHSDRRGLAGWFTSPLGAGLAMAAVLALAVGVALQFTGPRPIATPGAGGPAPTLPSETAIALENQSRAAAKVLDDVPQAPGPDLPPLTVAAGAPETGPAPMPVEDIDRALALLAEGRLLVRVRVAAPDQAIADMGRLANQPNRPGKAFRIEHEVSSAIALAMEQRFAPAAAEPAVFAADTGHPGAEPFARTTPRRSPLEAVYMADARMDKAALLSLQAALSLGDGRVAQFEELPEPLALPQVLTPDAVLWWSRPPGEWSSRAFVPVVIERVDR